ncbi:hypothetical protein E2562_014738 [Oryza meyeriana var. granulata]|uniref:Uncharacterized protein n=1 Tax=Oryza meyeriana var. granulata TaxID=110450 RepID=A0A6G1BKE0_9ORYZ|nr:hypothetical protein E2562_014738 [Oryza meyeriana var. granulata]
MVECGVSVGASTWNAVFAGCVHAGEGALAIGLLSEMVLAGGADVLRELHGFVMRNTEIVGFGPVDLNRLRVSLAVGYMRSCYVEYADRVFQDVGRQPRGPTLKPDVAIDSWFVGVDLFLGVIFVCCPSSRSAAHGNKASRLVLRPKSLGIDAARHGELATDSSNLNL